MVKPMHFIRSLLKKNVTFIKQSFSYFLTIDGTLKASALAFGTVISVVPFMVLSLGFLLAFPTFAEYLQNVHEFIFRHLVPSSANTIQKYVETFALNATKLSATNLVFFMLTAVWLIFSMETVFNSIWQVKKRRHGLAAFLMYWAILTLLPPLGALGVFISLYLYSLPLVSLLVQFAAVFIPVILSFVGYLLLYIALPNCTVKLRHASIGAAVAACTFEISKALFKSYITYSSTDAVVYGVVGAIPVFLFWLYLFWIITLYGAVIAYLSGLKQIESASKI
jgi:membrane protein